MTDFLKGAVFALLLITLPAAGYTLYQTQVSAQVCAVASERTVGLLSILIGARP